MAVNLHFIKGLNKNPKQDNRRYTMNIEKYFYCDSENWFNYSAEMHDNVGCKAEDAGDILSQYANECNENLPLCKCFAQCTPKNYL